VENQTGKKIKVLRSVNGGEYTSKEMKEFCREEKRTKALVRASGGSI